MIEQENIEIIFDKKIVFNKKNSHYRFDGNNYFRDCDDVNYDSINICFEDYKTRKMIFCINLSNSCNLSCDYCFNKTKDGGHIPFETVKKFLELCFLTYPNMERYQIDLSGKGEPLLFLNTILKIKDYCDSISNKIKREVLLSFVCNGTLLNEHIANILQKKGILFGVSVDGTKHIHDLHRKDNLGLNTFTQIINNVRRIKENEYIGCATTITKDVFSLIDSIKELSQTFNTLSYKPARSGDLSLDNESLKKWIIEYKKLTRFLLDESRHGNHKYIKTLLNGDDYFGKFMKRIFLNQRCLIRCDAGIGRLSLNDDNKIYVCPSAYEFEEFIIGDIHSINRDKQSRIFDLLCKRNYCDKCNVKYICGGECLVEAKLSGGINSVMCEYKKILILLSIYLVESLKTDNYNEYINLLKFVMEIDKRNKIDIGLYNYLDEHPELNFVEGKKEYDKTQKQY